MNIYDASPQQIQAFVVSQITSIEQEVYRIQYPELIYKQLVPIDSSANEWAKSITYFGIDKTGEADWFDGMAQNMNMADINRFIREQGVEMGAIGYRYTLEEIGQAMMIPGLNLASERAESAVRAYEEFMDRLTRIGDHRKGITGLFNNPRVPRTDAIADGSGDSALWSTKSADQQNRDVQSVISQVHTGSQTVEMADTILLPITQMQLLSDMRLPNTAISALEYLTNHNMYTHMTGLPLFIRGVRGLENAGSGGTGRLMAYRRSPQVVKLHVPMRHRFLDVFRTSAMAYEVPGIFRTGGVDIRRPLACAYLDGI